MLGRCPKCSKIVGMIFLAVGILYLGSDYAWWTFWKLQWFTSLFLIIGIAKIAHSKCKDCQEIQSGKAKK